MRSKVVQARKSCGRPPSSQPAQRSPPSGLWPPPMVRVTQPLLHSSFRAPQNGSGAFCRCTEEDDRDVDHVKRVDGCWLWLGHVRGLVSAASNARGTSSGFRAGGEGSPSDGCTQVVSTGGPAVGRKLMRWPSQVLRLSVAAHSCRSWFPASPWR